MNTAVFSNSHYINNLLVLFQVMSHPKLLTKLLELLYLEHKIIVYLTRNVCSASLEP